MIKKNIYYGLKYLMGSRSIRANLEALSENAPVLYKRFVNEIINYSRDNVPYYRSHDDFNSFPVLTKDIIRNNKNRLTTKEKIGHKVNCSGGSTGEPISIKQDILYSTWSFITEEYYFQKLLNTDYLITPKIILWGSERDAKKRNGFFE